VPALRQNSPQSEVGIALNLSPMVPASASRADLDIARYFDGHLNRWFLDPLHGRHYPADVMADHVGRGHLPPEGMAFVRPGDMEVIATPIDFVGVNYYTRIIPRDEGASAELPQTVSSGPERTEMGWEVYPPGLYHILNRLHFEYGPAKLYVTESGCSYPDGPDAAGRIADQRRIDYLCRHLEAAHRSIQCGVPLAGHFVWSLVDNFEWARGYSQRFGLVWVDYRTQQRIPKDSASWYRAVIERNGLSG